MACTTGAHGHLDRIVFDLRNLLAELDVQVDAERARGAVVREVPQARHRVIILGIRSDAYAMLRDFRGLQRSKPPTVQQVIGDLPSVSPQVSSRGKGTRTVATRS